MHRLLQTFFLKIKSKIKTSSNCVTNVCLLIFHREVKDKNRHGSSYNINSLRLSLPQRSSPYLWRCCEKKKTIIIIKRIRLEYRHGGDALLNAGVKVTSPATSQRYSAVFLLFMKKCGEWRTGCHDSVPKVNLDVRSELNFGKGRKKGENRENVNVAARAPSHLHWTIICMAGTLLNLFSLSPVSNRGVIFSHNISFLVQRGCTEGAKSHTDSKKYLTERITVAAWLIVFNNPIFNWNETVNTARKSPQKGKSSDQHPEGVGDIYSYY